MQYISEKNDTHKTWNGPITSVTHEKRNESNKVWFSQVKRVSEGILRIAHIGNTFNDWNTILRNRNNRNITELNARPGAREKSEQNSRIKEVTDIAKTTDTETERFSETLNKLTSKGVSLVNSNVYKTEDKQDEQLQVTTVKPRWLIGKVDGSGPQWEQIKEIRKKMEEKANGDDEIKRLNELRDKDKVGRDELRTLGISIIDDAKDQLGAEADVISAQADVDGATVQGSQDMLAESLEDGKIDHERLNRIYGKDLKSSSDWNKELKRTAKNDKHETYTNFIDNVEFREQGDEESDAEYEQYKKDEQERKWVNATESDWNSGSYREHKLKPKLQDDYKIEMKKVTNVLSILTYVRYLTLAHSFLSSGGGVLNAAVSHSKGARDKSLEFHTWVLSGGTRDLTDGTSVIVHEATRLTEVRGDIEERFTQDWVDKTRTKNVDELIKLKHEKLIDILVKEHFKEFVTQDRGSLRYEVDEKKVRKRSGVRNLFEIYALAEKANKLTDELNEWENTDKGKKWKEKHPKPFMIGGGQDDKMKTMNKNREDWGAAFNTLVDDQLGWHRRTLKILQHESTSLINDDVRNEKPLEKQLKF